MNFFAVNEIKIKEPLNFIAEFIKADKRFQILNYTKRAL